MPGRVTCSVGTVDCEAGNAMATYGAADSAAAAAPEGGEGGIIEAAGSGRDVSRLMMLVFA